MTQSFRNFLFQLVTLTSCRQPPPSSFFLPPLKEGFVLPANSCYILTAFYLSSSSSQTENIPQTVPKSHRWISHVHVGMLHINLRTQEKSTWRLLSQNILGTKGGLGGKPFPFIRPGFAINGCFQK